MSAAMEADERRVDLGKLYAESNIGETAWASRRKRRRCT